MIPGRTNVGDVESVRKLAILEREQTGLGGRRAICGKEMVGGARRHYWSPYRELVCARQSEDGAYTVFAVRSADNKDRWFVKVDPLTGAATVLDSLRG